MQNKCGQKSRWPSPLKGNKCVQILAAGCFSYYQNAYYFIGNEELSLPPQNAKVNMCEVLWKKGGMMGGMMALISISIAISITITTRLFSLH